jgi:hypothetical protein
MEVGLSSLFSDDRRLYSSTNSHSVSKRFATRRPSMPDLGLACLMESEGQLSKRFGAPSSG